MTPSGGKGLGNGGMKRHRVAQVKQSITSHILICKDMMMGLAKGFDEFMLTLISSKVAKDSIRGVTKGDIRPNVTVTELSTFHFKRKQADYSVSIKPSRSSRWCQAYLSGNSRRGVAMEDRLHLVLKDCVICLEHAKRKTITVSDVSVLHDLVHYMKNAYQQVSKLPGRLRVKTNGQSNLRLPATLSLTRVRHDNTLASAFLSGLCVCFFLSGLLAAMEKIGKQDY
ncbi:hypothetical protein MMC31_006113 [Peltigera leucophlebia]|nr:hypothetical protein [Peltigera leucophlebia]